jgi:hypothetical protein
LNAEGVLVVLSISLVSLCLSAKRVEVGTAEPTFDFTSLPLHVLSLPQSAAEKLLKHQETTRNNQDTLLTLSSLVLFLPPLLLFLIKQQDLSLLYVP